MLLFSVRGTIGHGKKKRKEIYGCKGGGVGRYANVGHENGKEIRERECVIARELAWTAAEKNELLAVKVLGNQREK